jgi:hypothetical protein
MKKGKVFEYQNPHPNIDVLGQHLGQLLLEPDVEVGQEGVATGEYDVGQKSRPETFVTSHHTFVDL